LPHSKPYKDKNSEETFEIGLVSSRMTMMTRTEWHFSLSDMHLYSQLQQH